MIKSIAITIISIYLIIALAMGIFAVIVNKKALAKMGMKGQLLFFLLQPFFLIWRIK